MSKNSFKIDKSVVIKPGTEPASPEAGELYYNSSQNKFKQYDGTNWKDLGSGSGTINFITNPDGSSGTTGWTEGSFTAAARPSGTFTPSSGAGAFAISTTTTTPLGTGTTSFLLTKSSGNQQGRAVETSFALPLSYRAKVLQIEIDYILNSTGFLPGTNLTNSSLIWYCAFSNDNGATYTLAEPSSFKMLSSSQTISDKLTASIQSPYDATNMKLIAYVSQNDPFTWTVKCITKVSPSQYVYGTPITDWQSYTPTIVGGAGSIVAALTGKRRRVGDTEEYQISYQYISGTGSSSELEISIANTIDMTKCVSYANYGSGSYYSASGFKGTEVRQATSNSVRFTMDSGTWITGIIADEPGSVISVNFSVPILGWSSSVQMSDGYDGRVVAARMYNSGNQSFTSGIATKVTFNGQTLDTTRSVNTSTSEFRIPSAGVYRFTTFSALASGSATLWSATLYVNGASTALMGVSNSQSFSGYTIVELKAGDLVTLYYTITGTSPVTQGNTNWTNLTIEKLSGSAFMSPIGSVVANYTSTSGNSVGTTATKITFDTKEVDTNGAYSSGEFVAPSVGFVDVTLTSSMSVTLTPNQAFRALLYKNGSFFVQFPARAIGNGNLNAYKAGGAIGKVPVNAGDKLEIYMISDVAGNLGTSAGDNRVSFSMNAKV